jgi:hypothetical protein
MNPDPNTDPDPIRIQGFDVQNLKEKIQRKIFFISFLKKKLQFTYVQTRGEASALKREHPVPRYFLVSIKKLTNSGFLPEATSKPPNPKQDWRQLKKSKLYLLFPP